MVPWFLGSGCLLQNATLLPLDPSYTTTNSFTVPISECPVLLFVQIKVKKKVVISQVTVKVL
jgi:hypothetical protein